jgi:hypothetical protein
MQERMSPGKYHIESRDQGLAGKKTFSGHIDAP